METGLVFTWIFDADAELTVTSWGWRGDAVNVFDAHSYMSIGGNAANDIPGIIFLEPPWSIYNDPDPNGVGSFTYYFHMKNISGIVASVNVQYLTVGEPP